MFAAMYGTKLLAIRFRNHATQQPPSLYWSEFAGRTLNTKYPGHPDSEELVNEEAVLDSGEKIGKHTIVASEPTTYDEHEWHLIKANHALLVDEEGEESELRIEYDEVLNAKDPKFDAKV
ncbi:hypothetical protein N0V94_003472 [Neodidymelliopsis sp. IMI 364377]|nr:hypothetical protein N0V94_003472 [Neodidymelliopsis sp. IMI 364377]